MTMTIHPDGTRTHWDPSIQLPDGSPVTPEPIEDPHAEIKDELISAAMREGISAPFVIDSEGKADWAVNKMIGWTEERARRKAAWEAQDSVLGKKIDGFAAFVGPMLREYAEGVKGKAQTVKLPCGGSLKFTTSKEPKLEIVNEEAVVAWALSECPGAVRFTTVYADSLPSDVIEHLMADRIPTQILKTPIASIWEAKGMPDDLIPGANVIPAGHTTFRVAPPKARDE